MATHYSANQFEGAFCSQRLQNYEVPAIHKERPATRAGSTKVIANDRGHLLPEVERSTKSPWGEFVGTWEQEPKPVKLQVRTKMVNPRVTVDTSWKRNNPPPCTQTDLEKKATPTREEEVASHPVSNASASRQSIGSPKPEMQNGSRPASNVSQRTTSRQSVGSPKPEVQNGSRPASNVSQRTASRQSAGSPKPEVQNGSRPASNVSQRTASRQSVGSPKPEVQNGSRPASYVSQRTASRQSVTSPSPAPGVSRGHQVGSMHGTPLPQSPTLLEN